MLSDRAEVLNYFERHGGVLTAIRCLDEGVDIPLVDHALILASSSNPREFIQRRGRVLRSATGKNAATIHDVLVVPPGDGTELRPLLKVELGRAAQFSRSSRNTATSFKIRQLASQLGIDSTSEMDDFEDQENGP
jgi:superfamily II DNA or RNA helicase